MKSFTIVALFLSSAALALPAGVKRQTLPSASDVTGASPAAETGSPEKPVEVDTSALNSNGTDGSLDSDSGSKSKTDTLGLDTPATPEKPAVTDSATSNKVTGGPEAAALPGDDSSLTDESDTGAVKSSSTEVTESLPTDTTGSGPKPAGDDSSLSGVGSSIPSPPPASSVSASSGACTPGKYQCNAGSTGWEVCDVLGTWVTGGECQSGTKCTFNAANGSPYCIPGAAGASVGVASAPEPPVVPDSGASDIGAPSSNGSEPANAPLPTGADAALPTDTDTETSLPNEIPSGAGDNLATATDVSGVVETDTSGAKPEEGTGEKPKDIAGAKPTDTNSLDGAGTKPTDTKSLDGAGAKPTSPPSGSEMENNAVNEPADTGAGAEPSKVDVNVPTKSLTSQPSDTSDE